MDIRERAVMFHGGGMNCAQAVLCSLSEYTELDEGTARSAAAAFGGGIRSGEACGAITGAAVALGLCLAKDGSGRADTPAASAVRELVGGFKESFGCVRCAELLERHGGHAACDKFIAYCAASAEKLIKTDETSGE